MNDTVLVDRREDGVALVTLNRPESLNAMNTDLSDALRATLAELAADPAVRCVALTGQGRAFCAGGDVKSMRDRTTQEGIGPDGEYHADVAIRAMQDRQLETSGLLHTMPKPTVALVNGYAMGAGFSFALACDLRLCSERAKFGMAFRNVGLPGDFGGAYFLPRVVGQGLAREIYFTGELIDAERAQAIGLVNRVYPRRRLPRRGPRLRRPPRSGADQGAGPHEGESQPLRRGRRHGGGPDVGGDQHAHVPRGPRSHRRPRSLYPRRQARLPRALTPARRSDPRHTWSTHVRHPHPGRYT